MFPITARAIRDKVEQIRRGAIARARSVWGACVIATKLRERAIALHLRMKPRRMTG
jgi:hypothetical protein